MDRHLVGTQFNDVGLSTTPRPLRASLAMPRANLLHSASSMWTGSRDRRDHLVSGESVGGPGLSGVMAALEVSDHRRCTFKSPLVADALVAEEA